MEEKVQNGTKPSLWQALYERLGLVHLSYRVPEHAQTLPYMLGGLTLASFILLMVGGIYLAQFYNPNQLSTNASVVYLITKVPFGNFARSVHFFAANIAFILVLLHLIRGFATGSYKRPREVTWLTGLGLLGLTMAFVFTGTMLSLGQEGVEALEHNSEMGLLLGVFGTWFTGAFTASVPLIGRVYIGHIVILVALLFAFIAFHFYLIKAHGISPKAEGDATTGHEKMGTSHFNTHLKKLAGWSFILFAVVFLLALLFPESLGSQGVTGIEVSKPPWMFLWLFGLEDLFGIQALLWGPALLFVLFAIVLFLDRSSFLAPKKRFWIMIYGAILLVSLVGLSIFAALAPTEMPEEEEGHASHVHEESFRLVPVAYAHTMASLTFSPTVIGTGQELTVSADGIATSGKYEIFLKGTEGTVFLGSADVEEGEDHFEMGYQIPDTLPGGMYSLEIRGAGDTSPDIFASLQLAVQKVNESEMSDEPVYTKYPIPTSEIPFIVGAIVVFLAAGVFLLKK